MSAGSRVLNLTRSTTAWPRSAKVTDTSYPGVSIDAAALVHGNLRSRFDVAETGREATYSLSSLSDPFVGRPSC